MISRGCARRNCVEREAELGGRAGLEVLHEHVGPGEHRREHGLVVIAGEIEHQRFLAAVEPDEIRALAGTNGIRRVHARSFESKLARFRQLVVAAGEVALGPLDLDHARAGIGEAAGAHRRRHRLLERNDEKAGQGKGHGKANESFGGVMLAHIGPDRRCAPSPLVGEGGEGGSCCCARCVRQLLPPPLTPPHKGEGNTPRSRSKRLNTKVCGAHSKHGASPRASFAPRARRCYSRAEPQRRLHR